MTEDRADLSAGVSRDDWMLAFADRRTMQRKVRGAIRAQAKRIQSGEVDPFDEDYVSAYERGKVAALRHIREREGSR